MIIPHDQKIHRGGEDSADSHHRMLVVSDGVGSWARRGVNPGLFSKELTRSILEEVVSSDDGAKKSAKELLAIGCQRASRIHQGTATVVVLRLLDDMRLESANLGDSGYALFHVDHEADTLEMYYRSNI